MNPYRKHAARRSAPASIREYASADPATGAVLVEALLAMLGVSLIMLVLVALMGCAGAQKAAHAVKLGGQAVAAAEPILVAAYAAAQEACMADENPPECIRAVRSEFEPVISSIKQFHEAYCDLADYTGAVECKP